MLVKGKYTTAEIFASTIDEGTIEQTKDICNHPIFKDCQVKIMPDCHKGKGCTIGFTSNIPHGGEIIPNIIGVDQSCGMYVVKLKEAKPLNDYAKLDKVIRQNIPTGTGARKEMSSLIPDELKEQIHRITTDFLKEGDKDDLLK